MFLRHFTQIFGLPHLNSIINHSAQFAAHYAIQQPVSSAGILFKQQPLFMVSQLLIVLAITLTTDEGIKLKLVNTTFD